MSIKLIAKNQTPQQRFLDEFTLEIVLNLLKARIESIKQKEAEEKTKKAVEVEKLKLKFQQYSQPTVRSLQPQEATTQKLQIVPELKQEKTIPMPIQIQPIKQNIPQKPIKTFHKEINEPPQKFQLQPQKQVNVLSPEINSTKNAIDKILFLINNPQISHIECRAENTNVVIRKSGQMTRTEIILSKEEILQVIKYFSEKAKIPLIEGLLLAHVDNLEISATISESSSSSFIIKKIQQNQNPFQMANQFQNPNSMNQNPLLKKMSTPLPSLPNNKNTASRINTLR
jgi:hypothetical protein